VVSGRPSEIGGGSAGVQLPVELTAEIVGPVARVFAVKVADDSACIVRSGLGRCASRGRCRRSWLTTRLAIVFDVINSNVARE
jgi:hypothetical protein